MELILLILKIILIAFLIVLGFSIFLLGLILFVPIRYEVSGSIGDSWDIKIKGKISYLLSIIKLLLSYEDKQFDRKLFLFGFEKVLKQDDTFTTEEQLSEKVQDVPSDDKIVEAESATKRELDSDTQSDIKDKINESEGPEEIHESIPTEEKQKAVKKQKVPKDQSKKKFDFLIIKQELTDEHNKYVVKKIWSQLGYLLRHFGFRKIETDLIFSTGDPASTGQILGVLCMIPALYRYRFKIVPDFEAESFYIKGTFLIVGKVRLIHVLITVLRLIFDKEVRLVVKKILTLLEK